MILIVILMVVVAFSFFLFSFSIFMLFFVSFGTSETRNFIVKLDSVLTPRRTVFQYIVNIYYCVIL